MGVFVPADKTALPSNLLPVAVVTDWPAVASQYTFAPADTEIAGSLAMSKTPSTLIAPSTFALDVVLGDANQFALNDDTAGWKVGVRRVVDGRSLLNEICCGHGNLK